MNIAWWDEGKNIVAHIRMDNAWFGSIDISSRRLYASRAFDIETIELGKAFSVRGQFFGIHASNDGKTMIFAGASTEGRGQKVKQVSAVVRGDQDHAVATATQLF